MYLFIKRIIDILLSLLIIICILPFIPFVYCLLAWFIKKPLIFKQKRTGLNEGSFYIYKIRTIDANLNQETGIKNERINPLGSLLRRWSIDEFPQVLNVLKGDMSFVGPRPQLHEFTDHIHPRYRQRFLVKPGITGLAQVNGRNQTTWEERFNYDLYYVHHLSFWLDLKIMIKTPFVVLMKKGIIPTQNISLPPFFNKN